jgi:rhamnulokinase
LSHHFLGQVVEPGREIAPLRAALQRETGLGPQTRAVAVAGHDTAAAVAATPVEKGREAAFINPGTWSLLGREAADPNFSDASLAANYTKSAASAGASSAARS